MNYLVEVPVDGGQPLVVEASESELPGDLVLAARPGEIVGRAHEALEDALERLQPALTAIRQRLESMTPSEIALEFGIKLGSEAGVVITRGTAEVNFKVTLKWQPDRA